MNEVNISPCAKSVTTQLAELKRHELRRNNASPSFKTSLLVENKGDI